MFSLDDYHWLMGPAGREAYRIANASASLTPGELKVLAGCTESRSRMLFEQVGFARGKARNKFSQPERWLWIARLLEQASDEATAAETALDFPEHATVVDGCCGAGADAVALSARGCQVLAIDNDPIACALAQANLGSFEFAASAESSAMQNGDVRCGDICALDGSPEWYLNLDPDRRSDGSRTIEPQRMNPTWDAVAPLVVRYRGASLKMAPGFRARPEFPWNPASAPHAMRWLSTQGSVRQQRWYWNIDRWPSATRIASMHLKSGNWHHEVFSELDELAYDRLVGIAFRSAIGKFVADQDPVVRAAEVHVALAQRLRVNLIGAASGYYHAESCVLHPMLQWFRVLEIVPMDEKKIRALARSLAPRVWELKSRGVDVEMERMQRILHTDRESSRALTILFARQEKRHMALFTERVTQGDSHVEAT